MTVEMPGHEWSEEALFCKAQIYTEQMEQCTHDDWRFGFWSALTLEIIARAALAHVSPILLANNRQWKNLVHALGQTAITQSVPLTSVSARDVFARLSDLIPEFNPEMHDFCVAHSTRRNSELHSGTLSFEALPTSNWLPKFYWVCDTLVRFMDKDLSVLISDSKAAHKMIDSLKDKSAKAVRRLIAAHERVWQNKSCDDQKTMTRQAATWAARRRGHRVECPACKSTALVVGRASGPELTEVNDEEVIKRQAHMPSSFECIACTLKISGFSKLSACGLGDTFTRKTIWSVADYYDLHTSEELEEARAEWPEDPEYEPDFNE